VDFLKRRQGLCVAFGTTDEDLVQRYQRRGHLLD
jgi:hypothetical protein